MNRILVYFYGYKSRSLPQAVEQLIKNQSGQNSIHVLVYDQTNVSRPEKFVGAEYNHINWDTLTSKFKNFSFLKNRTDFDFFIYIDGAKMFEKDWDIELLNYKKSIVSGNHDIIFNKDKYKFYPDYTRKEITTEKKTNWVVKDFFFMSFSVFKTLPDISIFKYYGVEEYLSLYAANFGISVVAIPTNLMTDQEPSILEKDFVPFSLYHNYAKVIDCFKSKDGSMAGVDKLMETIDYNFTGLEYFPYPVNDVDYNFVSNLDKMSEQKFLVPQNNIY